MPFFERPPHPRWEDEEDEFATDPMHGLHPRGGGGSGSTYEQRFRARPLPDEGPLLFVCEWPAHGIPESSGEVDAALLRDEARRAQRTWELDAMSVLPEAGDDEA